MSIRLSSVTIALNDEQYIGRMLESVKPYVDEMIVLDGGSSDRTAGVAEGLGATVAVRSFDYDFGEQRNRGGAHAKGAWHLAMDCDEILEPALGERLGQLMAMADQQAIDCFQISEKNIYEGEPEEPVENLLNWPDYHRRLYRSTCFWQGFIHEQLEGWIKEYYVPTEWGSIEHRKNRADQSDSDNLYYLMRPTNYPDRLARDPEMQRKLRQSQASHEDWLDYVREVNPSKVR